MGVIENETTLSLEAEKDADHQCHEICCLISEPHVQQCCIDQVAEACIEQADNDKPNDVSLFGFGYKCSKECHRRSVKMW